LTITNGTNTTVPFALDSRITPNFTLPAWDGNPGAIGAAVDRNNTRSAFYIGTDNQLYQVASFGSAWRLYSRPNATYWPKADDPKAPLAVACDYSKSILRIYYQSGGQIIEANGDRSEWTPAVPLPNYNISTPAGAGSTATASPDSGGLSTGAKVGVGVGVTLGVLAIAGIMGAIFFLRRRQRRRKDEEEKAAAASAATAAAAAAQQPPPGYAPAYHDYGSQYMQGSSTGYSDGQYSQWSQQQQQQQGYYDVNGTWTPLSTQQKYPGELESAGVAHEMEESRKNLHEMIGEGHYREVPDTPSPKRAP
jgi:hypothetical protein